MNNKKAILITVFLTLGVLVLIVGGIIGLGMKTAPKAGKEGKCVWGAGEDRYRSVVCEGYVKKDGPITVRLKNVDPKEVFLSSASAIQCSNKNGYFMCVGLMKPCQLVGNYNTNETGEFQVTCPILFGPMKAKIDFNVGTAEITWER